MDRNNVHATLQAKETRLQGLLLKGMDGDASAYRTFLSELTVHLRGFLRKRLYNRPGDIEDLVQEVLLAIHNGRHSYRPDQPLTAWIHAIARYKVTDYFRAYSRLEALNNPLDDALELLAASDLEAAQAKRDLAKLLTQLPDRQKLPIVHVKLEGLSVVETAKVTGLSESAVKIGVHRGLKALAAKMRGMR